MPTYETLNSEGFAFTQTGVRLTVLEADFGDGFKSAALVGDPNGLRSWNIKIEVLPDTDDARAIPETGETRARYLWNFFLRSKAAGDRPFWVEDTMAPRLFLAEFVDQALTFEVLCARIYSTGLQLQQRRVQGVLSPVDLYPPAMPVGLVATAVDDTHIDLMFSAANANSYKIERRTGAGPFAEIAAGVTSLPYHDSGLVLLTEYFYRVRATNTAGDSEYSAEFSATTLASSIPNAPSALVATGSSASQIDLSWVDNSSTEIGFKIERKTPGGTFAQVGTVAANITTWSNTGLSADASFIYRVRAYTAAEDSPYSNEAAASTMAPAYAPAVYASFFQPDSTTAIPATADTGQATIVAVGQVGTKRYWAYPIINDISARAWESGIANGTLRMQVPRPASTVGFFARYNGTTSGILVRVYGTTWDAFVLTLPGSFSAISSGTYAAPAISEFDWINLEMSGANYTLRLNGRIIGTFTSATNQTATKHGFYSDSIGARLKHFICENRIGGADHVRVNNPVPYRGRQRTASNKGSIPIEGIYAGTPLGIEARWNAGAWVPMSFASGIFSGTLLNQNAGEGWLEVRFIDNHAVSFSVPYVGIGDVFGVVGQSNAEGRIQTPQFYAHATLRAGVHDHGSAAGLLERLEQRGANDPVLRVAGFNVQQWREAFDPTDLSGFTVEPGDYLNSVWPLLATQYMAQAGVPVYFIATAHGQTGLFGDGGTHMPPTGVTYLEAKNAIVAADPGGLKGLLWYGNESDGRGEPGTQAALENALKLYRSQMSTDLGFGDLEMWIAQLATVDQVIYPAYTRASLDLVRLAQTNVVNSDAHCHVGPILYDIDTIVGGTADGVHVTTIADGAKEAARWWHMLKHDLFGAAPGRGPQFASAAKIDATHIDVVFTLSGSATLMAAAPPTAGWRVVDGAGVRTVTGTARQSNTTVRLTLDATLTGAITVSWASFNDARGRVFTDNSTDAMPVEPFVDKPVA